VRGSITALICAVTLAATAGAGEMAGEHAAMEDGRGTSGSNAHPSRISDEVIPLQVDAVPDRPRPRLELGDPFLGVGPVGGWEFEIPTGAVWRPSLLLWGSLRTAIQRFDDGDTASSEWANRLDLYGNLQLTGTERLVFGFRPFDQDEKNYSGVEFSPGDTDSRGEFNGRLNVLFFEGDFGEIFPGLDPEDRMKLDYGFSVGRQPLLVQDGLLINDIIESVGVVRNTLLPRGVANLRITGLYGWGHIDRGTNRRDSSANLYGLFSEADFQTSTVSVDLVFVDSKPDRGDAFFIAASAVQRIGHFNTTFRAMGSIPTGRDTPDADGGALLVSEVSFKPLRTDNIAYLNVFAGIGDFVSAARRRGAGGPLGRVGILFASPEIGRYAPPLSNDAQDVVGASVGYQMFLGNIRRQLILELGARQDTDGSDTAAIAGGVRFQQAFGQHHILQLDGFIGGRNGTSGLASGVRCEWRIKF